MINTILLLFKINNIISMSIWHECHGIKFCKVLDLEPWRIVEAQNISSSRDLVENREELDLLEQLL